MGTFYLYIILFKKLYCLVTNWWFKEWPRTSPRRKLGESDHQTKWQLTKGYWGKTDWLPMVSVYGTRLWSISLSKVWSGAIFLERRSFQMAGGSSLQILVPQTKAKGMFWERLRESYLGLLLSLPKGDPRVSRQVMPPLLHINTAQQLVLPDLTWWSWQINGRVYGKVLLKFKASQRHQDIF